MNAKIYNAILRFKGNNKTQLHIAGFKCFETSGLIWGKEFSDRLQVEVNT